MADTYTRNPVLPSFPDDFSATGPSRAAYPKRTEATATGTQLAERVYIPQTIRSTVTDKKVVAAYQNNLLLLKKRVQDGKKQNAQTRLASTTQNHESVC